MPAIDEFGLIAELFAPLAESYPGALGLTDDCALVSSLPGTSIAVTADAIVAGVHFLADDPPDLIARKLLRVNLSDLAAMGAVPFAVLMTAAFPRGTNAAWLRAFAEGLRQDLTAFEVALIGGDTVATPGPLTLSVTAMGRVEEGRALRRSVARPGDLLFVSGSLGDAALGLRALQGGLPGLPAEAAAFLIDRYRVPRPRLALGPRLVGLAHACMDVSDGLLGDLAHILKASGVGAVIEAARLPLSGAARAAGTEALAMALGGGDDYELLFTSPPSSLARIDAIAEELALPLTVIGRITDSPGITVVDADGTALVPPRAGYRHFQDDV